jgi:hypothetical protein
MKKVVIVEDNLIEAAALEKILTSLEENLDITKTGYAEDVFVNLKLVQKRGHFS